MNVRTYLAREHGSTGIGPLRSVCTSARGRAALLSDDINGRSAIFPIAHPLQEGEETEIEIVGRPVTCKGVCCKAFFERCPKQVCHRLYESYLASEDRTPFIGVIIRD